MYYNNDKELFLKKLENNLQSKLSKSSINVYVQKIKKLLKSGYSVSDLCGGIDQLIEDYSPLGEKYDKKDHGNTKSALSKVRNMIKGDMLSSFSMSYERGFSVAFPRRDMHITKYEINNEKIVLTFNSIKKKLTRKINPVNMGKLINIFETAEKLGLISDSLTELPLSINESTHLVDASSKDMYGYIFKNINRCNLGCLFKNMSDGKCEKLQKEFDDIIAQIIAPYKI